MSFDSQVRDRTLPQSALKPSKVTSFALAAQDRLSTLVILAMALTIAGLAVSEVPLRNSFFAAAASLVLLCLAMYGFAVLHRRKTRLKRETLSEFIAKDSAACLLAGPDGSVMTCNASARKILGPEQDQTVAGMLDKSLANPSSVVFRLQTRAQIEGSATEDISTRSCCLRLSVHQAGNEEFLWRLDEVPAEAEPVPEYVVPKLLVNRNDDIDEMNGAARKLLGSKVAKLNRVFRDMPVVSGSICNVESAEGLVRRLVHVIEDSSGRLAYFLLPPEAGQSAHAGWSAFENLPVPLLKVDCDGNIQAFNKMASNLIGIPLHGEVHISETMEGLGRSITEWLQNALNGRTSQSSEFLRLKRRDKEAFVQVTLNRVTENGDASLIAVLSDATELKSLEAQFVQSQKMQAIGQLAGGVAHDFNNLLTAISGHCDLLLLRHDQGDPDFSDLVQINQNANRAAALVGQLLAFSRKQTLRPETLDMRDTLSDLTHLLNRLVGEKVTLTLSHDPILQPIRADKRQLEQVLMNLVVNARDAMPKGGEIKIVTECTHLKKPLVRDRVTVPVGDYVTVQVIDEGIGIPADKMQKVFEPFFTTKRTGEGTGLGLSTAYGIVKQTGGYIFVDSKVGKGTCFTLYFPVLERNEPATAPKAKQLPQSNGKHGDGVILLVEDEAPVRAFASRALRLRGYTVLEADSAEAALKTLEDESLNVDVFVTDVVMPGMDGPSWVREALKERPGVRVVFVSGYAEDSFGEAQTKIPNSVFLPKPFSLNDLTDTVHQQLH